MKKVNFENGNITGNILQTAFPMLIAQVLNLLYNIVDRIYIGRIPDVGTEALGAVGFCFPVIIIVTAFTNMFGMGGSPLFSMELGKKEPVEAAKILNTSLRLLIVSAVLITVFG
jgi:Na+-driven multidrug efflux pump